MKPRLFAAILLTVIALLYIGQQQQVAHAQGQTPVKSYETVIMDSSGFRYTGGTRALREKVVSMGNDGWEVKSSHVLTETSKSETTFTEVYILQRPL